MVKISIPFGEASLCAAILNRFSKRKPPLTTCLTDSIITYCGMPKPAKGHFAVFTHKAATNIVVEKDGWGFAVATVKNRGHKRDFRLWPL